MDIYGLIGYPIGHSFSAKFFNEKFAKEKLDAHYELFPIENINLLPQLIKSTPGLKGFNVTIPYKQQVIPYLDMLSEEAEEMGAVNVVKLLEPDKEGSQKLVGFNSDAIGFRESLIPLLKPYMTKALVLGTGGASKAVLYVLRKLGIECKTVSRSPENGDITYSSLTPEIISQYFLIVNTTPLGMWPEVDNKPKIPYDALTPRHLCYDVVYNPETTAFMKAAAENGAVVKNGLEMLHGQAVAAWEIWNS